VTASFAYLPSEALPGSFSFVGISALFRLLSDTHILAFVRFVPYFPGRTQFGIVRSFPLILGRTEDLLGFFFLLVSNPLMNSARQQRSAQGQSKPRPSDFLGAAPGVLLSGLLQSQLRSSDWCAKRNKLQVMETGGAHASLCLCNYLIAKRRPSFGKFPRWAFQSIWRSGWVLPTTFWIFAANHSLLGIDALLIVRPFSPSPP